MKKLFYLRYFDGEGTAPEGAEGEAAVTANDNELATQEVPTSQIKYGIQPETQESDKGKPAPDRADEYKNFKKQYQNEFQADLQRVIDKRFKNSKQVETERDELKQQNERYGSLMSILSERYGTDDIEELVNKFSEDDSYFEQKAMEHGMTVEDYKRLYNAEHERDELQKQVDEQQELEQRQAQVEQWLNEAEELNKIYPDFDLEKEFENEDFANDVLRGDSMRKAYQNAHFDEIVSGAIRYAAQTAKDSVAKARAERAQRPLENGVRARSTGIVKSDPSKLTDNDIDEISERVRRGEKISFN